MTQGPAGDGTPPSAGETVMERPAEAIPSGPSAAAPVAHVPVPPRPRHVRGPFGGFVVAVVAVGMVAAVIMLLLSNQQVPVLVARADLPAYTQLGMDDLEMGTRTALDAGAYAELPVEGRITLRSIRQGEALTSTDLSPDVRGRIKGGLSVVGLDVSRAAVLGGALGGGDPVQVVLVMGGRRTAEMRAVVLTASQADASGTRWSLMIALNREQALKYAAPLAKGSVLILRDPDAGPVGRAG
ncbi:SAF domain-containing protein [Nonomuraea sp. NPDC050394]|uniref:SAF domain-containing protein n=1 Tax=Nonomuraea sp. NPDC050394 TaxID=3364363 RepID=UPI0037986A89